jgi:ribonuclease P protein component
VTERLPRSRRITSSKEIRALITKGKRSKTAHLDVFDSASLFSYPRVGVVVPKHRRTAVERNKLKRRIREVLRKDVLPVLRNMGVTADVLVRTRREAYEISFDELRAEIVGWMDKRWSRER